MRLFSACLLSFAACSLPVFAQQTSSPQQAEVAYDLWRVRSQTITDDLLKDSAALATPERAILWARLAQRWWRDDPEKARTWMLKPIEIVEAVPNKENPSERNQRITTARLLLKIVAPLDQNLSKRLVAVLSDDAEHMADAERGANAEGLVEAAMSLVEKEPQRAAELGALALRVGRPPQIAWLISNLRAKDAKLGDALLGQTLEVARQTLDLELINSMTRMIFGDWFQGLPARGISDQTRKELLNVDVAFLQANPINAENREAVCLGVGSFIAPVLVQFARLLPQQAAMAQQAVNQCQSSSPFVRQRVDEAQSARPVNTVEDLLKIAEEAEDLTVRTYYQYRAASLAEEKNDFDRALKILDSMSAKSRELMSGSWEHYRWHWAALAALYHFKGGDIYKMRLIINAVPADLQAFARIGFVWELPDIRNKETDPTLEFLTDARTGLRRSAVSDAEKWGWYFNLLKLTVKYQPNEATAVLKEGVAALNRAEQPKDKDSGNDKANSLDGSGFFEAFPAALLDADEYAVQQAVSSITSPNTRAQVRLELLGVCLERMRNSKPAGAKSN